MYIAVNVKSIPISNGPGLWRKDLSPALGEHPYKVLCHLNMPDSVVLYVLEINWWFPITDREGAIL